MKCKSIIFLLIFSIGNCCGQWLSEGDSCTLTSTNDKGKCILYKFCNKAQQNLKRGIRPQTCGFKDNLPLVCCRGRVPGEISKKRCREYSAYTKVRRRSPILMIGAPMIVLDECGHKVVKLIVGGEKADRKEFPHMAAIGFEPTPGDIQWWCGGTIISNRFILTAAHCLSSGKNKAKYVRIGVANLEDNRSSYLQQIEIAERIPYPQYTGKHYHDIALLRLQLVANMTPYARPACLHLEHETHTEKAIASGWGNTAYGGGSSKDLMKVTLDLFDHSSCNRSYSRQMDRKLRQGIIDDLQLCAGSLDDEKDTCQGDSGGPLQIYHDSTNDNITCMYNVIGVTSFGKACSGSPGVYTRVSNYIKWIEDIVWPEG